MLQDLYKIRVMKDILHRPEQPEIVKTFIEKLLLNEHDEQILINKYCSPTVDKILANDLKISMRQYYKLLNIVHIRAYDAMKRQIRYKI